MKKTYLKATERHLPYGITPDISKRAPPQAPPSRLVLNLPTPNGWKAGYRPIYTKMIRLSAKSSV